MFGWLGLSERFNEDEVPAGEEEVTTPELTEEEIVPDDIAPEA